MSPNKQFVINPIQRTVKFSGFDFIKDQEMTVGEFQELCFKNNWEGTAYKVDSALIAFDKAIMEALVK